MKKISIKKLSEKTNPEWDGICVTCGHDYRNGCHGNCTCLSCNAERQHDNAAAPKMNHEVVEVDYAEWALMTLAGRREYAQKYGDHIPVDW